MEKGIRGNELRKLDRLLKNKNLNKQGKKDYIRKANKYYQNYEQAVETYVDGIGKMILPSDALKETITQSPEHIIDVIDLSKNLRKSKVLDSELPKHPHKYNITKFHHLRGKNVDYQVAENARGNKYFYKITDPYLTGPEPEGKDLLNTYKSVSNIIPSSAQNLNPSQSAKVYETSTTQTPKSDDEWLKWLKRKRKGML